jgi:Mrp family chromosome partitioning ATPase
MDENLRSLLVTSAVEQEGKTTTVVNLAYTMAQAGKTVLMIDADLRKPTLRELFSIQNPKGLSDLLADTLKVDLQSGSLKEFGLSDLFSLFSFAKKTGILRLIEGKERVEIYFQGGELTDVQWLTRPKEKKLAALLAKAKNGVLTDDQVKQALIRAENTGQKLGFVLINMGLVKEDDLAGFIILHIIEGLRIALQFKKGAFSFEEVSGSMIGRSAFQPADLNDLYRQSLIGEEEFIPPNPTDLLGSKRMSFLLSLLKRQFDILIIDTPPVIPATDALLLAPQTDGVLLVVKEGHTNREIIKRAAEQIRVAQANLIGVVLNQVDTKRDRYYSGKYYSRYYGESD